MPGLDVRHDIEINMKALLQFLLIAGCVTLQPSCILIYPTVAESDPALSGQVKDAKTGRPVEHVRVTRAGRIQSVTHTDSMGYFKFPRQMAPKLVVANPANTYEYPSESRREGVFRFVHDAYFPLQLDETYLDPVSERVRLRFWNKNRPEVALLTPKPASGEGGGGKRE